jgi:hypothetical protein
VDDFHRKEDNFSMTQSRLRSELRLQAGRAKYSDIILRCIFVTFYKVRRHHLAQHGEQRGCDAS